MELLTYKSKTYEYTYYVKNNKRVRHGLHKYWYSNGQLNSECNYKDGKKHGLYRSWYEDGELNYEYYYWEGIEYKSKEAYEESLITNRSW